MTKNERQDITLQKIRDNNYNGIINLCVRFGKTRIGIKAQAEYLEKNPKAFSLVVTPSQTISAGWTKEADLIKIPVHNVVTANMLLTYGKTVKIDLLIIDEAHKFTSTEWYNIINKKLLKYDKILLLTATLPIGLTLEKLTKWASIIDTIDEEEAVKNSWISNFVQFNIPLNYTTPLRDRYIQLSDKIAAILSAVNGMYRNITFENTPIFDSDMDMIYSIRRGKYLGKELGKIGGEDIVDALSIKYNLNKEYLYDIADSFIKAIDNRNSLMSNNEVKFDALLKIIKKERKPTIIFNSAIYFCEKVSDAINSLGIKCVSIHTKTNSKFLTDHNTGELYTYKGGVKAGQPKIFGKARILEHTIASMSIGECEVISTVNKLNEGITIPEIVTSGSLNPIQQIQREGRGKNLGNPDKVTKIYNLYMEDIPTETKLYHSRDKTKLLTRQTYSSNIKTINLVDI
jgi:superfamily II DNA or RNA helicase